MDRSVPRAGASRTYRPSGVRSHLPRRASPSGDRMTYLDELAQRIRDEVAESDQGETALDLFRLYAVLALAKGEAVQASDVHNAWVAWMQEREPDHEALKPFEEL